MFLSTAEVAELLKRERPELLVYQFWLASLLDRGWEAGREYGRQEGKREALAESFLARSGKEASTDASKDAGTVEARSSVSGNTAE